MVIQHLRQTIRFFLKDKNYFIINTIGFSIVLTIVLLVSFWVIHEKSFDNFHQKRKNIYRIVEKTYFPGEEISYSSSIPEWMVNVFEKEIPEIEASTSLSWASNFVASAEERNIEINNVLYADNKIFRILTFTQVAGSLENALSQPYTAVITENTAQKFFPNENPVGKTIKNQNDQSYLVTAVVKTFPQNSHIQFNMLLSMKEREAGWNIENDYNHIASTYVLLKSDIPPSSLNKKLKAFVERHMPKMGNEVTFELQAISDVHLKSVHISHESINWFKYDNRYLTIYLLTAFLILIIVSANFVNLSIANLSKRHRELSVKKIIGSGKTALIFQFIIETVMLLVVSSIFAAVFLHFTTPIFENFFVRGQHILINKWYYAALFMLAICIFIVLLACFYPVLILSSLTPIETLRNKFTPGNKGEKTRMSLTIGQFGIAIALIVSLVMINKQVRYIASTNLGYNPDLTVILPSNDYISAHLHVVKEDLLRNPLIKGVTYSNTDFAQDEWGNGYAYEGQPENKRQKSNYIIVDNDFIDVYGIQMARGNNFSSDIIKNKNIQAFIINETLAKQLNCEDPIGKKFRMYNTDWGEIVGITEDFNFQSLHQSIGPLVLARGVIGYGKISVKINSKNIQKTLKFLESKWSEYEPEHSFTYSFLDQELTQFYKKESNSVKVFAVLTLLSVLLSVMGLFGIVSYMVEKRVKEIGIRKVNGAKISEILSMLNKDFVKWVFIAFVMATPIAWYAMNKWLENFAYKTSLSWWVFALAGVLALGIALLTVSWQSWRAATRNPVEALRYE
ncbi:ABC transporter permease [Maribellus maritimus]|uniref:ABC transporter permease n=1 Tax=Maribellus maritimus TaxID=2870838 RepID=UPI001EECD1D0|nr:ABC transporter permease [Maribellus maritimus]MCG6189795.1 ABC transporter permease [Maribellus maritimus]